jgi:hypothetical protein
MVTPELQGANDAGGGVDIRAVLRAEHEATLSEIDSLRDGLDPRRAQSRLCALRRAWIVHALAEETVVYRALEAAEDRQQADRRADERFIEHELVDGLFEKLSRSRPGTLEWAARLKVARDLVARHVESEHDELFGRLERNFEGRALAEMGERFTLARDKLTMLEEAKAA